MHPKQENYGGGGQQQQHFCVFNAYLPDDTHTGIFRQEASESVPNMALIDAALILCGPAPIRAQVWEIS